MTIRSRRGQRAYRLGIRTQTIGFGKGLGLTKLELERLAGIYIGRTLRGGDSGTAVGHGCGFGLTVLYGQHVRTRVFRKLGLAKRLQDATGCLPVKLVGGRKVRLP